MADSGGSRSAASSSLRAPSMPPPLLCLPSSPLPCVVEVAMTSSTPDLASSSTGRRPRCGHRRRFHLLLLDAAWEEGRHRAPLGGAAVLGVGVGDGAGPELLLPRGGRVDDEELERRRREEERKRRRLEAVAGDDEEEEEQLCSGMNGIVYLKEYTMTGKQKIEEVTVGGPEAD
uniref:Uncharacterized protein n=1 Tax=Oryza glumipatula TaxID=40148 RepID=A0A0D9Y5A0_9ORYZ